MGLIEEGSIMSFKDLDIEDMAAHFPAEFRVHWPGQTVFVCEAHKLKALGVARAMGMPRPTVDSFDIDGEECSNCQNEACK